MLKRFLLLLFSAAFTVIAIIGLLLWSPVDEFTGATFSQEKWAANGECQAASGDDCVQQRPRCPRGAMAQDLRQNFLHNRETTKTDVSELIGDHDTTVVIGGEHCEAHYLGMCSPMSFDGDSLYVCYDQNDALVSSGHIRH
ncbi:hypothetical protein [Shimia sp. MIT910701]|uniref:hypothetical protein n=1 Tax=Shimia sp. MIT910701 TaxID=3096987 RepID=UPI00399AD3F1